MNTNFSNTLNFKLFEPDFTSVFDNRQKIEVSGRQAWNLLHTTAAYLPSKLSSEEQIAYKSFVDSILFFTVKNKAEWKDSLIKANEKIHLDFTTRDSACLSMCYLHNEVNLSMKKWQYPCFIDDLNERWGKQG